MYARATPAMAGDKGIAPGCAGAGGHLPARRAIAEGFTAEGGIGGIPRIGGCLLTCFANFPGW